MISKILDVTNLVGGLINLLIAKLTASFRRKKRAAEVEENVKKDKEIDTLIKDKNIKDLNKEFGWDPATKAPIATIEVVPAEVPAASKSPSKIAPKKQSTKKSAPKKATAPKKNTSKKGNKQ